MYVSFSLGDTAAALNGLQSCLVSVQSWTSLNKLKLNPDETEFFLIGDEWQRRKYHSMFPIELFWCENLPICSKSRLIFDKNFNFRSHMSVICSACFYNNWDLRCVHRYPDLNNAKLLTNSLVSSCLDYCNSLLSCIADTDLAKLQRVQNQLAHVVTK